MRLSIRSRRINNDEIPHFFQCRRAAGSVTAIPASSVAVRTMADGTSLNAAVKREGLVFKSLCGSQSWKVISNKWLLKHE